MNLLCKVRHNILMTDGAARYEFHLRGTKHPFICLTQQLYIPLGLVYYKNPRAERPSPDSVVILTVRKASDSDTVFLAAKIPLASQRLPLQFRFPKPTDTTNLSSEDLIVQAQVCAPENVDRTTKSCTETVMTGLGIAKALQFTSPDDPSQQVSLRAGVSIALENVQKQ